MHTEITQKMAAFGLALLMNTAIIGGVAYLFQAQVHQYATLTAQA